MLKKEEVGERTDLGLVEEVDVDADVDVMAAVDDALRISRAESS